MENAKLLSEVIKGFIEDGRLLIITIGIALTMLANAGLIVYNVSKDSQEKSVPRLEMVRPGAGIGGGHVEHAAAPKPMKSFHHIRLENIILLIISGAFAIPLFFVKKKNNITDIKGTQ